MSLDKRQIYMLLYIFYNVKTETILVNLDMFYQNLINAVPVIGYIFQFIT